MFGCARVRALSMARMSTLRSQSARSHRARMQALGQPVGTAAKQVLERDGALRQLAGGHAEQRPRRGRLEVDLHARARALVANANRSRVESTGKRPEALALHRPSAVELDDHDNAATRRLARSPVGLRCARRRRHTRRRLLERGVRTAANQMHGHFASTTANHETEAGRSAGIAPGGFEPPTSPL